MFRRLANGNDANVVATLSMSDGHNLVIQEAEGEKPLLSIGLACVLCSESDSAKDRLGIDNIDAVPL